MLLLLLLIDLSYLLATAFVPSPYHAACLFVC